MRNKNFSAAAFVWFVVAAGLVISSGCGKNSPTSPSPNPGPDQSQYETLPATHPILDENGKETTIKMWVELSGEPVPPRGSFVKLGSPSGPPDCSKGECYQFPAGIRMYFGGTPNPAAGARFIGSFSEDSKTACNAAPIFDTWAGPPGARDHPAIYGTSGVYQFFPIGCTPRYLLIEGEYFRDGFLNISGEKGKTSFLLDYKVR